MVSVYNTCSDGGGRVPAGVLKSHRMSRRLVSNFSLVLQAVLTYREPMVKMIRYLPSKFSAFSFETDLQTRNRYYFMEKAQTAVLWD
jgi:hypothetical protein